MSEQSDIDNILNYLDSKSGQGLRKRNDMETLLELAAEADAHEELNALAFNGAFLYNLYGTLRKASPGSEGFKKLEQEFTTAVETIRNLMAKLLVEAGEDQVHRFDQHYYQMTQGSLRNVIDLAHDLGVLKAVQNEQKYSSGEEGEAEG